jgi:hypothetical protein
VSKNNPSNHTTNNPDTTTTTTTTMMMRIAATILLILLASGAGLASDVAAAPAAEGLGAGHNDNTIGIAAGYLAFHERRLQAADSTACSADLNADGVVATDDLLLVLATFGRSCAGPPGDQAACNAALAQCAVDADAVLQAASEQCTGQIQTAAATIAAQGATISEMTTAAQANQDTIAAQGTTITDMTATQTAAAAAAAQILAAANAEASQCEQTLSSTINASATASEACASTVAVATAEFQTCTQQLAADSAVFAASLAEANTTATGCEAQRISDAVACNVALSTAIEETATCSADLVAVTAASATSLSAANSNTEACVASLGTVTASRDTCTADLATCTTNLANMTTSRDTCTADLASSVATIAVRDATIAELTATNAEQHTTCEQAAAQTAAAHQQQLRALRCAPAPVLPFADVTGDLSYGGNGLTVTCHDGYADNGATSGTLQCTTAGTWEAPDGAPMLECASIDPCSLDEDDCDALADCAHTGPGTHECECTSGVAFGTGQVCSQCSPACDIGQVQTAPCTSTADIACEAVIASEVLPEIDGATLTYSNEQSYPTTATYACGDNEMSRTLQPDGTWSAAGELSCGPTWILGAAGESCDTVCAAEGLPCTGGDWGVNDQASFEAALEAAGQSSSDRASLCSGGYSGTSWDGRPTVGPRRLCRWQTAATTLCSATSATARRLCRCV